MDGEAWCSKNKGKSAPPKGAAGHREKRFASSRSVYLTIYSSISCRKSTPPQNRQLILISYSTQSVDEFWGLGFGVWDLGFRV